MMIRIIVTIIRCATVRGKRNVELCISLHAQQGYHHQNHHQHHPYKGVIPKKAFLADLKTNKSYLYPRLKNTKLVVKFSSSSSSYS